MKSTEQIKQRLFELIQKSEDKGLLEIVYQILNHEATRQNDRIHLTEVIVKKK